MRKLLFFFLLGMLLAGLVPISFTQNLEATRLAQADTGQKCRIVEKCPPAVCRDERQCSPGKCQTIKNCAPPSCKVERKCSPGKCRMVEECGPAGCRAVRKCEPESCRDVRNCRPGKCTQTQKCAPPVCRPVKKCTQGKCQKIRECQPAEKPPVQIVETNPVSAADELSPAEPVNTVAEIEPDLGPLEMADRDIPEFVPGQILYFSRAPASRLSQIAAAADVAIIETILLDQIGISMITARLKPGDTVGGAGARLEKQKDVLWAQPNHYFQLLGQSSRSRGLALHGIGTAGDRQKSGSIVMIDSLVDTSNAALAGAAIEQKGYGTKGRPDAHGTAIAELLVGTGDYAGVARGAKLISLAAFEPTEQRTWLSQTRYLAQAMNEASRLRPNVANLSFGANASDRILTRLLNKLESRGICVVSAAGNGNGGKVLFPARLATTLAVTAIDGRKRAYRYASKGPEINVAAWGVNLNAAVPGGRRSVSGTSFATAIVSGSLLGLDACSGEYSPKAMRDFVTRHAQDLGEKGHDDIFGAGLFRLSEDTAEKQSNDETTPKSEEEAGVPLAAWLGGAGLLLAGLFLLLFRRRRKKPEA